MSFKMPITGKDQAITKMCGMAPTVNNGIVWAEVSVFERTAQQVDQFLAQHPYCIVVLTGTIRVEQNSSPKGGVYYNVKIVANKVKFIKDRKPSQREEAEARNQYAGGYTPPQGGYTPPQGGYPQQPAQQQGGYPQQPAQQQSGYSQQSAPQQGGYTQQSAPQQCGYSQPPAPQQRGYTQQSAPQQGGYTQPSAPQQGGYTQQPVPQAAPQQTPAQQNYKVTQQSNGFTEISEDDGDLPF